MSASTQSPGTPFRTVASGLFDGGAVTNVIQILSARGFTAIARTGGVAAGSFDLTYANPNPAPTNKVAVKATAGHLAGGHNLQVDYLWVDASTLRVSFRIDDATLTNPDQFSVTVKRVSN